MYTKGPPKNQMTMACTHDVETRLQRAKCGKKSGKVCSVQHLTNLMGFRGTKISKSQLKVTFEISCPEVAYFRRS